MKISRRIVIPHVSTLDCDCGGNYQIVKNHRVHFQDTTDPEQPVYLMHQCTGCGKQIWLKNQEFPREEMLFDEETKEEIGELNEIYDEVFRDKIREKVMTTPVLD